MVISDVVETVTYETETWLKLWDRDLIKNPETRDLKFETETRDFEICAICGIKKESSSLLSWIFSNFWHFSDLFSLFLTCKYNKQKIVELWKFHHFVSLLNSVSRPVAIETEAETSNLRDRDSQKWVSRLVSWPKPSVETPSLMIIQYMHFVFAAIIPCIQLLSDEKQEQISHGSSWKLN